MQNFHCNAYLHIHVVIVVVIIVIVVIIIVVVIVIVDVVDYLNRYSEKRFDKGQKRKYCEGSMSTSCNKIRIRSCFHFVFRIVKDSSLLLLIRKNLHFFDLFLRLLLLPPMRSLCFFIKCIPLSFDKSLGFKSLKNCERK